MGGTAGRREDYPPPLFVNLTFSIFEFVTRNVHEAHWALQRDQLGRGAASGRGVGRGSTAWRDLCHSRSVVQLASGQHTHRDWHAVGSY